MTGERSSLHAAHADGDVPSKEPGIDGLLTRVYSPLRRLSLGNLGDVKRLGGSISELRIDYGPGYRVYFTQRGARVLLLLCGGDKRSQQSDIVRAREISDEWT